VFSVKNWPRRTQGGKKKPVGRGGKREANLGSIGPRGKNKTSPKWGSRSTKKKRGETAKKPALGASGELQYQVKGPNGNIKGSKAGTKKRREGQGRVIKGDWKRGSPARCSTGEFRG